jgi:predicted metal-dependent phosphoesterase TrpH
MKFDMHCHTKEGSMDGKVAIHEYVDILKEQGFQGMLVTDHNSYKGYRAWCETATAREKEDFVVLRGIEYDTIDSGHIIVIMPEEVKLKVLEMRGLPVRILIDIVHKNGGILGPAHPCGERYLSLLNTKRKKSKNDVMHQFDFVEVFNACETKASNLAAKELAKAYQKPGFGGSDAHRHDCVGTAFTKLEGRIRKETDLIAYVKSDAYVISGGVLYEKTTKDKLGKWNRVLVESFFVYNKLAGLARFRKRRLELRKC